MLILATDTSGLSLSVAVCRDSQVIGEADLQSGFNHSVTYMPLLEDLLRRCSITLREIDLFACSVGPGSFTGIRIGVSSVKAMAYAAGKPAVGISTLLALTFPYRYLPGLVLCPVLDARNGRVYSSLLRHDRIMAAEKNRLAADLVAETQRVLLPGETVLVIGSGRDTIRRLVTEQEQNAIADEYSAIPFLYADDALSWPRAAAIARLALESYEAGQAGSPQNLLPQYCSPSQAERKLKSENA